MQRLPPASDQHARSAPAIEPIAMRIPDACRYVGVGRTTLYVLIGTGQVAAVKLGRSTLVLTESLKRLIAERRPVEMTGGEALQRAIDSPTRAVDEPAG